MILDLLHSIQTSNAQTRYLPISELQGLQFSFIVCSKQTANKTRTYTCDVFIHCDYYSSIFTDGFIYLQSAGVSSRPGADVVIIEFHIISYMSKQSEINIEASVRGCRCHTVLHPCVCFFTDYSASSIRVLSVFEHDKANKTKEWIFSLVFHLITETACQKNKCKHIITYSHMCIYSLHSGTT